MSVSARLYHLVTERVDPRPLAVLRVIVGLAAIGKLLILSNRLTRFYHPDVIHAPYFTWFPAPTRPLGMVLGVAGGVAAVCFTLGLRTRWGGAALTAVLSSYLALDQQLYSNHLYLLLLWVLLLTIADSGAALGWDARAKEPRPIAAWPAFLIKVQLSIMYGFTAIAKVNAEYLSGAVFRHVLNYFPLPVVWRTPGVFSLLAAVTILVEGFLAVGLWVPRLRPAAFVMGVGLHTGILLTMSPRRLDLMIFGAISLAPYLLFLDVPPASRLVVWDENSTLCRSWIRWCQRLDWLGIHRFIGASQVEASTHTSLERNNADEALYLISPAGRVSSFAAVRVILEVFPVSFLLVPLLRLPPLDQLGRSAYRAVAMRRRRILEEQLMPETPIILFDGVCNLCNGWVQFIIKRDARALFRFAALQSLTGQLLLTQYGLYPQSLDSMVLIDSGSVSTKSDAVLRIAGYLPGMWPLVGLLRIVPRWLRNGAYDRIAENRYRWFGKKDACMVPMGDIAHRFLE